MNGCLLNPSFIQSNLHDLGLPNGNGMMRMMIMFSVLLETAVWTTINQLYISLSMSPCPHFPNFLFIINMGYDCKCDFMYAWSPSWNFLLNISVRGHSFLDFYPPTFTLLEWNPFSCDILEAII